MNPAALISATALLLKSLASRPQPPLPDRPCALTASFR